MIRQTIRQFTQNAILPLMILIGSTPAHAVVSAGVSFDRVYKDQGVEMELRGTGVKSVFFLKAFVAGFYKEGAHSVEDLGEFSKRIEVKYFVEIPAYKLHKFTLETMKDNIDDKGLESIEREIDLMAQYFVDLKSGDRFSLTYIPDVGTHFAHNNELTGVIEGQEFARALFSVWLGEKPFDKKLKNQILGISEDRYREEEVVRIDGSL